MVATACRRNCTQEAAQCRHISRWARRGRERFGTQPGVLPWLWAQQPSRRRCHRSSDCPRQFQPPRVVGPYRPRRTPRVSPYRAAAAGTAGGLALRLVPRENRRNSRAQLRRCRLLLPKTLRIRTAAGLPARVRASRGGAGAAAAVTHASTTSERSAAHTGNQLGAPGGSHASEQLEVACVGQKEAQKKAKVQASKLYFQEASAHWQAACLGLPSPSHDTAPPPCCSWP